MALAIFMYVSFFVIGLGLIVGFPMIRWYQITHSDDDDDIDLIDDSFEDEDIEDFDEVAEDRKPTKSD